MSRSLIGCRDDRRFALPPRVGAAARACQPTRAGAWLIAYPDKRLI
jgi:hypothetical protein